MSHDVKRAARATRVRMAELGWSNPELAERAEVARDTIRIFLSGTRWPNMSTRHRLEAALGWPPSTLDRLAAGEALPDIIELDPPKASNAGVTITLHIPSVEWDSRTPRQRELAIAKAMAAILEELEDQDRRDGRA